MKTQLEALRGLAEIIGKDNVARIEFMKAIGLTRIPFMGSQFVSGSKREVRRRSGHRIRTLRQA
jgi:hypothetical protein